MVGNNHYLLVVDDKPEICKLLADLLTNEGYTVKTAVNGDQAILTIRAQTPVLILIDINMPEKNGIEILEEVRGIISGVPVFAITGNWDSDLVVEARNAGLIRHIIPKPFDIFAVIQLVKQSVPPVPRVQKL